jgi:dockerin type I repeat protein
MRKRERAVSAAISAVILGSASVSMASTPLFTDNFNEPDGNPLNVNGVPAWTAASVEGTAMAQGATPNIVQNTQDQNHGSQITENTGSLSLTVTQNFTQNGATSSNDGPILFSNNLGTANSSAFNFWQHPVQITIKAAPGGNLMPHALNATDHPLETSNQSFFYMQLSPTTGGRPDNSVAQTYLRISNGYGNTGDLGGSADEGPITTTTTQYFWRAISNNNTTPTFVNLNTAPPPNVPIRPIDPQGRVTSMTLFMDGSRFNHTKGTGANNQTPVMFNWGCTFIDRNGATHTYWVFHSGTGTGGGTDAPRADANFGSGNYGGVGPVGADMGALYNAWVAAAGAGNPNLDSALGLELLRGVSGYQQQATVELGSIQAINPQSPGDVNYDGVVDTKDFTTLAANFAGVGPTNPSDGSVNGKIWYQGDMTGDGKVNALDFNILASNFGTNYNTPAPGIPLGGTAVPEPAALTGLLLAAFGLVRRRRA